MLLIELVGELGLAAAISLGAVMGLTISALGAGGSLFIVPVLLYLFHSPMQTATGTSLGVVFAAALVGALGHARRGRVRPRVALLFGGAAMVGAVLGASASGLVSERTSKLCFATALVVAAIRMARGQGIDRPTHEEPHVLRLLPLGLLVGVLTGFLGVGGGFIIVPVLIWGAGLGLRDAIGTSLAVIALSSITGAASYLVQGKVDPSLLFLVGSGAVLGALIGAPLSGRVPERPIRYGFAGLALLLAGYMILRG